MELCYQNILGSRESEDGKCYAIQTNSWNMRVMFDDDCQDIGITVQIMHRNETLICTSVCLHMWMEYVFWVGGSCPVARSVKGSFQSHIIVFLLMCIYMCVHMGIVGFMRTHIFPLIFLPAIYGESVCSSLLSFRNIQLSFIGTEQHTQFRRMAVRLPSFIGQSKAFLTERWFRCSYDSVCQTVRYWWHGKH
jgi:hypothetical protein